MASQLTGLVRTMAWDDYRTVDEPAPTPPITAEAATTAAPITNSGFALDGHSPTLRLRDSIVVRVSFDAGASNKKSWVAAMPQGRQDQLLAHEQGHYDLTALLARDFFVALMMMKATVYANASAMQTDLNAAQAATVARAQEISDAYDDATTHGTDSGAQTAWSGHFRRAFNTAANPPQTVDGAAVKMKLIDVLKAASVISA